MGGGGFPGGMGGFSNMGGGGFQGFGMDEDMGGGGFQGGYGGPRPQDPPITREYAVDLEDLYKGCVKRFNVTKTDYTDPRQPKPISNMREIKVQPGWRAGTKATFRKEGDIYPGREPADMVFVLTEKPHQYFKREKDDLVYTAKINLKQAMGDLKLNIPTLDGQTTSVVITDRVIDPKYVHRVVGKGMPISKQPGSYGDLLIKFDIAFPRQLDKEQKKRIKDAFEGVQWKSN